MFVLAEKYMLSKISSYLGFKEHDGVFVPGNISTVSSLVIIGDTQRREENSKYSKILLFEEYLKQYLISI